jgi:hypothetical protein
MTNERHCQQAAFARAECRIELKQEAGGLGPGRFVATASVMDPETHQAHPLVFKDGARIAFPSASEPLALSTMLTYLEGKFGAFSEIVHGCLPDTESAGDAQPMVVELEPVITAA